MVKDGSAHKSADHSAIKAMGRLEEGHTTGQQGKAAREAEVDFWHPNSPSLQKLQVTEVEHGKAGDGTHCDTTLLSHAAVKEPALMSCPVSTSHSKGRGLQHLQGRQE